MSKWLREAGVEDVQLRSLPWSKLEDKSRRKGMWWLPQHDETLPGSGGLGKGEQGLLEGTEEGAELMKAASEQVSA